MGFVASESCRSFERSCQSMGCQWDTPRLPPPLPSRPPPLAAGCSLYKQTRRLHQTQTSTAWTQKRCPHRKLDLATSSWRGTSLCRLDIRSRCWAVHRVYSSSSRLSIWLRWQLGFPYHTQDYRDITLYPIHTTGTLHTW